MVKIEELKALLAIDKNALDDEVSRHPMLFFEVAEAFVDASAKRDACKEELSTVDAELDGLVRRKLESDEVKITEAMVKNGIQTHERHTGAFDTYMEAKTEADVLGALKEAFHSRGYMLRDLCSLNVASYYESTSQQGTNSTDREAYNRKRERLAEARGRKDG